MERGKIIYISKLAEVRRITAHLAFARMPFNVKPRVVGWDLTLPDYADLDRLATNFLFSIVAASVAEITAEPEVQRAAARKRAAKR